MDIHSTTQIIAFAVAGGGIGIFLPGLYWHRSEKIDVVPSSSLLGSIFICAAIGAGAGAAIEPEKARTIEECNQQTVTVPSEQPLIISPLAAPIPQY